MSGLQLQFSLYQTPHAYEAALSRHAQFVRWMQGVTCTCIQETGQAWLQCPYCKGRGVRYVVPQSATLQEEKTYCDVSGIVQLQMPCVSGSAVVIDAATRNVIPIESQQGSNLLILAYPFPSSQQKLLVSYETSFTQSLTLDPCTQIAALAANQISVRPQGVVVEVKNGLRYSSTIVSVSQVKVNGTVVPVLYQGSEILVLDVTGITGPYTSIQASYVCVPPFRFIVHSISDKVRWETGAVQESATAMVVVPYYIKASVHDLFVVLSAQQTSSALIDPAFNPTGNDTITNYFDLCRILGIFKSDTTPLPPSDIEIYDRNQLMWRVAKPTDRYVVKFLYHPTFSVIPGLPSLRNAEDKAYVNRINVVEFVRTSGQQTF